MMARWFYGLFVEAVLLGIGYLRSGWAYRELLRRRLIPAALSENHFRWLSLALACAAGGLFYSALVREEWRRSHLRKIIFALVGFNLLVISPFLVPLILHHEGRGLAVIAVLLNGFPVWFALRDSYQLKDEVIRGTRVLPQRHIQKALQNLYRGEMSKADLPGIPYWRSCRLPRRRETQHILIVGSSGSGKTQLIYPLLEEVMARGDKAVVWDVKGTYIQALSRHPRVRIMAPWDRRSIAWRPGADIRCPLDCQQAAAILIPRNNQDSQPYFLNSARHVFEAVLLHLDAGGEPWGWKDVWDMVSQGKEALSDALQKSADGRAAATLIQGDSKGSQDVYATLISALQPTRWLARAWPRKGVSLRRWVGSSAQRNVLILGGVPEREELAGATARLALQVLVNECLSLPDDLNRRVWFFLDELGTLGRMDSLLQAFAMGRSKGLCVVAGIQNIGKIEHVYGRDLAKSIANIFGTAIYLRCSDVSTSQWASDSLGLQETRGYHRSQSRGISQGGLFDSHGRNTSMSASTQQVHFTKPVFLASEISNFPDLSGVLRVSGWPVALLRWPLKAIPQFNPLVKEADWTAQKIKLDWNV